MIKIKLQKTRNGAVLFKLGSSSEELDRNKFMKRAILDSINLKGEYNYKIPMRYFEPLFNNLKREVFCIGDDSIDSYFEFSDEYDCEYYYSHEIDEKYMKKWRMAGCPSIYKVSIDFENKALRNEIIFEKVKPKFDENILCEIL